MGEIPNPYRDSSSKWDKEAQAKEVLAMWIVNLLTAAPLRGYRTQVLGGVAFIGALASWLVGDMTLVELIQILPEMAIGLGLTALGAKQNTVAKNQGVSVK